MNIKRVCSVLQVELPVPPENNTNEPGHEKMCHVIFEQQRRRSACAFAQSDQRLCCSLLR